MNQTMLSELESLLSGRSPIVHVTHVNPDADGLGSAVAMSRHVKTLGLESRVLLAGTPPRSCDFLLREGEVAVVSDDGDTSLPDDTVLFVYDVSTLDRLGPLADAARRAAPERLFIFDHHEPATELPCPALVDPTAGATAQVVADVFEARGVVLTLDLALPLYVALVADTGSFNYGKTTPATHHVAARLLAAGVDPLAVHGELEGRRSLEAVRLAARAIETLARDDRDPRIAHVTVTAELLSGASPGALDSIDLVNETIGLDGVEAGVLLQERTPGATRLSFRCTGKMSILAVARALDGGGHHNAAGATVPGTPGEVLERVLGLLREETARQLGPA